MNNLYSLMSCVKRMASASPQNPTITNNTGSVSRDGCHSSIATSSARSMSPAVSRMEEGETVRITPSAAESSLRSIRATNIVTINRIFSSKFKVLNIINSLIVLTVFLNFSSFAIKIYFSRSWKEILNNIGYQETLSSFFSTNFTVISAFTNGKSVFLFLV